MGEGGGEGSGKWMVATFNSVVPRWRLRYRIFVFSRPPWDGGGRGEGSGKWMAATLSSVVAAAPTV